MRTTTKWAIIISIASLVPITALLLPGSGGKGLYTKAQADDGAKLYAADCAACHGKDLEGPYGAPALKGQFTRRWSHAPLSKLFLYISQAMPKNAPGSLTPDQNIAIVAFLLRENGLPAGKTALPTDVAKLDVMSIESKKHRNAAAPHP